MSVVRGNERVCGRKGSRGHTEGRISDRTTTRSNPDERDPDRFIEGFGCQSMQDCPRCNAFKGRRTKLLNSRQHATVFFSIDRGRSTRSLPRGTTCRSRKRRVQVSYPSLLRLAGRAQQTLGQMDSRIEIIKTKPLQGHRSKHPSANQGGACVRKESGLEAETNERHITTGTSMVVSPLFMSGRHAGHSGGSSNKQHPRTDRRKSRCLSLLSCPGPGGVVDALRVRHTSTGVG